MQGQFLGQGGFAKCYVFKELGSDLQYVQNESTKMFAAKVADKDNLLKER